MKIPHLPSAIVLLLLSSSASFAQTIHLSLMGGQTVYPGLNYDGGRVDLDRGFNAGLRLGYGLDEWLPISGLELQVDGFYNQSDLSSQTKARFDSLSYMGNLVYSLDTGTPLSIYGGAGAGGIRTEIGDPLSPRNSNVFGWQALGGVKWPLSEHAKVFAEYRHQNAHNANLRFIGGPVGNTSDNASFGIELSY